MPPLRAIAARVLPLTLIASLLASTTLAPLAWAECPHHLGVFASDETVEKDAGDYFATLAELPPCVSTPESSGQDHENHPAAPCGCGDQSCLSAKAGAAPEPRLVELTRPAEWSASLDEAPAQTVPEAPRGFLPPAVGPPGR